MFETTNDRHLIETARDRHEIERDLFNALCAAHVAYCKPNCSPTTSNVVTWTMLAMGDPQYSAPLLPIIVPLIHELIASRRRDLKLRCALRPELYDSHAALVERLERFAKRFS